jgi:hypothetical protein
MSVAEEHIGNFGFFRFWKYLSVFIPQNRDMDLTWRPFPVK